MDNSRFEDLLAAFERNIQTSAFLAASTALTKILRMMWNEIQKNKSAVD